MRARTHSPPGCRRLALLAALLFGLLPDAVAMAQTPDPMVRYFTRTTDLVGNPISSVIVGEQFKLEVITQDIRDPEPQFTGVFSPAVKVLFDDAITPAVMPLNYLVDDYFDQISDVLVQPGEIFSWGVSVSPTAPGNAPQPVFSIVLEAVGPGMQVFTPAFFETPDHATQVYGTDDIVSEEQMVFEGSTLSVLVPEPGTWIGMLLGAVALGGYVGRARGNRFTHRGC